MAYLWYEMSGSECRHMLEDTIIDTRLLEDTIIDTRLTDTIIDTRLTLANEARL
jgi:hypothetical protein